MRFILDEFKLVTRICKLQKLLRPSQTTIEKGSKLYNYDMTHCPFSGVEVEEQDHENRDRY